MDADKQLDACRKTVIGVMGGGVCTPEVTGMARQLGRLIALQGWVLLNGGRAAGVMEASARGAREAGGLTVGVLPDPDGRAMSSCIDIPIFTGLGAARNNINVLSSQVVVLCPGGMGTISEAALALKNRRPVVFLGWSPGPEFLGLAPGGLVAHAKSPAQAVEHIRSFLERQKQQKAT